MKKSLFILACGFLFSCSQATVEPVTKTPTATTETKVLTSEERLAQGKLLSEQNCAKCHKLFVPGDFKAAKWQHEVPEMAEKAKLTKEQGDLILEYVLAGAKQ